MAAIASQRAGNWSDDAANPTSPWFGSAIAAGIPTSADTVTLTHDVTLDINTAVCSTLTINSGGKLSAHASNNMQLTTQVGITVNSGGTFDFDVSSDNRTAYFRLNNGRTTVNTESLTANNGSTVTMRGASRKRLTKIDGAIAAGATQMVVDDATGWQVGDILFICSTQANYLNVSFNVTNVTWAGGYATFTTSVAHSYQPGDHVIPSSLQTNLNLEWVIYDCPTTTTFRVAMADPSPFTDVSGSVASLLRGVEELVITNITAGSGTSATIDFTNAYSISTTSGVAFAHADRAWVGNFYSNLQIGPANRHDFGSVRMNVGSPGVTGGYYFKNVMFRWTRGGFGYDAFCCNGGFAGAGANNIKEFDDCAWYYYRGSIQWDSGDYTVDTSVSKNRHVYVIAGETHTQTNVSFSQNSGRIPDEVDSMWFRLGQYLHQAAIATPGMTYTRCVFSVGSGNQIYAMTVGLPITFDDCDFLGVGTNGARTVGSIWRDCRFSTQFGEPWGSAATVIDARYWGHTFTGCQFPSGTNFSSPFHFGFLPWTGTGEIPKYLESKKIILSNINGDPTQQIQWMTGGKITRTSDAMVFEPHSDIAKTWEVFQVPAVDGELTTFSIKVNRSDAGQTVVLRISGLGITPVETTISGAAGVGVATPYSVQAVQNSGANGTLEVEVRAYGTTGTVTFDDWACPPTIAVNTGDGAWWGDDGAPVHFVAANYVTAADVWRGLELETGYTPEKLMRLVAAALAGRVSGLQTGAPVFRDINNTKDRITAVTDNNGNRTSITLDAS